MKKKRRRVAWARRRGVYIVGEGVVRAVEVAVMGRLLPGRMECGRMLGTGTSRVKSDYVAAWMGRGGMRRNGLCSCLR